MVGAGPTNLAAAIYTAREDIATLILEKKTIGGLAALTDKVDNYPGFANGVSGLELAQQLQLQAERFGAKIELGEVTNIKPLTKGLLAVTVDDDQVYRARTVLLGSGSSWRRLRIPGEDQFYGRGVHNCATCDGAFYRNQRLIVVGGGNSAAQESLFLTKFARKIDVLIRGSAWRATDVLINQIAKNPKIKVHFHHQLQSIEGDLKPLPKVKQVQVIDTRTDDTTNWPADGVFVFIGLLPATGFLAQTAVELDANGFIVTNSDFQTNLAGVFAAGDVRSGATMQIASAVGEGASAALAIRHYLDNQTAT